MYKSRKFWAFIISLVAIVSCCAFKIDASVGICSLYAIYCGGNCLSKFANKEEK